MRVMIVTYKHSGSRLSGKSTKMKCGSLAKGFQ